MIYPLSEYAKKAIFEIFNFLVSLMIYVKNSCRNFIFQAVVVRKKKIVLIIKEKQTEARFRSIVRVDPDLRPDTYPHKSRNRIPLKLRYESGPPTFILMKRMLGTSSWNLFRIPNQISWIRNTARWVYCQTLWRSLKS